MVNMDNELWKFSNFVVLYIIYRWHFFIILVRSMSVLSFKLDIGEYRYLITTRSEIEVVLKRLFLFEFVVKNV